MVGIGPFLPHHDTPFGGEPAGSTEETLFLLGILRLMMPELLLPATTALGTASSDGRERGILAGANVVMPNLSPGEVRRNIMLYDGKVSDGAESAQARAELAARVKAIGYELSDSRGDSPVWTGRKKKRTDTHDIITVRSVRCSAALSSRLWRGRIISPPVSAAGGLSFSIIMCVLSYPICRYVYCCAVSFGM